MVKCVPLLTVRRSLTADQEERLAKTKLAAEVHELGNEAITRIEAAKVDRSVPMSFEILMTLPPELRDVIELHLFLDRHAVSIPNRYSPEVRTLTDRLCHPQFGFVRHMNNMTIFGELFHNPNIRRTVQNSMPGTINRTTFTQRVELTVQKYRQLSETFRALGEEAWPAVAGEELPGNHKPGTRSSLKDLLVVLGPVLKVHRETCEECDSIPQAIKKFVMEAMEEGLRDAKKAEKGGQGESKTQDVEGVLEGPAGAGKGD